MDPFLPTWSFAVQERLQLAVRKLWPTESGNWPLLHSFKASGYCLHGTHALIVLRQHHGQFPEIGELVDAPAEWNLPNEPPSTTTLARILDTVREICTLEDGDAMLIIPLLGAGKNAAEDRKLWSTSDKELWEISLELTLERQLSLIVRNHAQHQSFLTSVSLEKSRIERTKRLESLSSRFEVLEAGKSCTPQERGKKFEAWLGDLFDVYELEKTISVTSPGEQIDFTFWKGDLFVVGEARWLASPFDSPQARDFFGKLLERPSFAVGLAVSISGFTSGARDYFRKHSGERLVLTLDLRQIRQVLKGNPEFTAWLSSALRTRLEHPNK